MLLVIYLKELKVELWSNWEAKQGEGNEQEEHRGF